MTNSKVTSNAKKEPRSQAVANSQAVISSQMPQEPPRVCPQCGRWMVVQIVPHGWWTICSRHGKTTSWGQ